MRKKEENFKMITASWLEQRRYVSAALEALGNHPLADVLKRELAIIKATPPSTVGWKKMQLPLQSFRLGGFSVSLGEEGSINHLVDVAR